MGIQDGGQIIVGYFYPPTTGTYRFSLAADDGGVLYFGTSVTHKQKIAEVKAFLGRPSGDPADEGDSTQESTKEYWSDARREAGAVSEPQSLIGGEKYYISAVEVNRQGRDALS